MRNLLPAAILIILFSSYINAQDTLTILHVNDTHSMLAPMGPRTQDLKGTRGGIARAATEIGMVKMTEKNVLTLHGGDIFTGDLFFNSYFGIPELRILNSLGFDAMAVGNHEFDLMPSTLLTAFDSSLADGGMEILSANTILEDPEVQALKKYIKPYTIKTYGNLKVGIFGMTTPSTNYLSLPAPAVIDTNLGLIAGEMVNTLMNEGCSLIIMLSHLGITLDKLIAANVPGINIIIGGHDHFKYEEPIQVPNPSGSTTYIVQAYGFYTYVGKLQVIVNSGVVDVTGSLIPLDDNIPEEPSVAAIVDELIAGIETTYGEPFYTAQVATVTETFEESKDPFEAGGNHSTACGNLITDAFRNYSGTDVAITVGGSIAQPLYEGPIVAADVFRMIGYGFNTVNGLGYRLTTFKLKGSELAIALQSCLYMTKIDDEFLPQVSGMKYSYTYSPLADMLVLDWITINDIPIDTGATYSITANEFLSAALPLLFQIPVTDLQLDSAATEFQVVLAYILAQGGTLSPSREARVTPVEKDVPGAPAKFNLEQNYPNPFNPETTIEFTLPERCDVKLKIYDALGSEVAVLLNEELSSGTHKVIWNAPEFASGIYFYQISAGNQTTTKKLSILK